MSNKIQIVMPAGAFGSFDGEHPLVTAMRVIGVGFGDARGWCAKYGCDYENDVFLMRRFREDCDETDQTDDPWMMRGCHPDFDRMLRERFGTVDYQQHRERRYWDPPQFWFKPSDFRLIWYKYIGRDMASNKDDPPPSDFLDQIFATHPEGKTAERAFEEFSQQERESAESFAKMLAAFKNGAMDEFFK
jgi:hypothetical protein